MRAILHHMDSPSFNVRIGCVWTIINLIVTEETLEARSKSTPISFLNHPILVCLRSFSSLLYYVKDGV